MNQKDFKLDRRTRKGKRLSNEAKDAAMSVVHLSDTIGGYNLPHVLTHAKTALKSDDLSHVKSNLKHVIGHATEANKAAKKMQKKIPLLPGVSYENQRLISARKQSYK